VRVAVRVAERSTDDDISTYAAALTYQALLSLVPAILLAASVIGFVFAGNQAVQDRWIEEITAAAPWLEDLLGRNIESLVSGRVQAGIVALAGLAWTGSTLAARGARALGTIFRVPPSLWLRRRLRALIELAVVGLLIAVSVGLTSLLPAGAGLVGMMSSVLALFLDLALFLAVYVIVTPPGGPPWRAHLPGVVLFGLAWTLLKLTGGWYTQYVVTRATAIYGAISAVIGVLAILALAAWAFLYGAELSAVLQERKRDELTTPSARTERS
jgi:membrane protein